MKYFIFYYIFIYCICYLQILNAISIDVEKSLDDNSITSLEGSKKNINIEEMKPIETTTEFQNTSNPVTSIHKRKELHVTTEALFRGFYVFLGLMTLLLMYMSFKIFCLRKRRPATQYKVIDTKCDDQETFFPLPADDEDEEEDEIFNVASQRGYT